MIMFPTFIVSCIRWAAKGVCAMSKGLCVASFAVLALLGSRALSADENDALLVLGQSQIMRLDRSGAWGVFLASSGQAGSLGGSVYVHKGSAIVIYDEKGEERKTIAVSPEVKYSTDVMVLPDKRMAFFDNRDDLIYFVNADGRHIKTVRIAEKPDQHLQNMHGVVVGGKLIVSENGHNELMAVDLATYKVSLFRGLKHLHGWLGSIAYADGVYYIGQGREIYSFKEGAPDVTKVATTPEGNITGIVAAQGRLFAVVNGQSKVKERSLAAKHRTKEGVLYEIGPGSGKVIVIRDGLNYPRGLLLLKK